MNSVLKLKNSAIKMNVSVICMYIFYKKIEIIIFSAICRAGGLHSVPKKNIDFTLWTLSPYQTVVSLPKFCKFLKLC